MADAGDMDVDAAVEFCQFAVKRFDGQSFFADNLSGMATQIGRASCRERV